MNDLAFGYHGFLSGCFDVLTVKFSANRRVGYYVIRIYFPCTLCTVVSWMAFWMDCRNVGDRGTVGVTSLLTQLFLVGNINEAMPHVSYVKAADLFLIVSFAFTFFALLESVLVYKAAAYRIRQTTSKVTPKKEKVKYYKQTGRQIDRWKDNLYLSPIKLMGLRLIN